MSDTFYAVSMALLKHAGIDPSYVRAVSYQQRVGDVPVLVVEYNVAVNGRPLVIDDEVDTATVAYHWRQVGATRTILAGTPEFDEWLAGLPRSEDQP